MFKKVRGLNLYIFTPRPVDPQERGTLQSLISQRISAGLLKLYAVAEQSTFYEQVGCNIPTGNESAYNEIENGSFLLNAK